MYTPSIFLIWRILAAYVELGDDPNKPNDGEENATRVETPPGNCENPPTRTPVARRVFL